MRAPASGITLNEDDAAIVKGMLERGDRQHDIAAWFGVNGGRIAEISTEDMFADVEPQTDNLPPPGPYSSGRDIDEAKRRLIEIQDTLKDLVSEIDTQIAKLSNP